MSKARKIIAAILVLCLAFGCVSASAATKGRVYESPSGNFTATKISHPEAGIGEPDGIINYDSGEPDRGQSYSWSAVGHGNYIYIGTCYGAIWTTVKMMANMYGVDARIVKQAVDVAFNGKLFSGDEINNPGDPKRSIVVKLNTSTGETKIVDGPDDVGGYRAAIEFNGKLYFCKANATPQIIEIDPDNNDSTKIVYQCEKANKGISVSIRGITVCDGELVVSMIGNDGAYIAASKNPSEGQKSFKTIATQEDLLDYPAYMYADAIFGGSIFDIATFNNKIYITVVVGKRDPQTKVVPKLGFALFEGEKNEKGEWKYNLIVGDPKDGAKYPYGFGGNRASAANMIVYDDYLYVGGYNDPMLAIPESLLQGNFENLYKDLKDPVSLWRMDKQGNWELVVGEPNEIFPERTGNMGEGFDNHMCQYVWQMRTFEDKLYVGTFDITGLVRPVSQFCNGEILKNTPQDWANQIKYIADLVNSIKDLDVKPMSLNNNTLADAQSLVKTMKNMNSLLNKGGIDDIESSEKFYSLLVKALDLYTKVRDFLPKEIAKNIDTVLNQENVDNFFYFIGACKYLSESQEGCDVLVTKDGVNFEAITRDGFGDKFNHGLRTFAINDDGIFAGTANPFYGTQVWKIDENNDSTLPGKEDETKVPADDKAEADTTVKDETAAPETDVKADAKEEAPNTGASAGIALSVTALAAGAALVITKKKKVF